MISKGCRSVLRRALRAARPAAIESRVTSAFRPQFTNFSSESSDVEAQQQANVTSPGTSVTQEFAKSILQVCPKWIDFARIVNGELVLYSSAEHLVELCTYLKYHTSCQFQQLMDVTAVDFPSREDRFMLVYVLQSFQNNARIRVKIPCNELTQVPTLCGIHSSANWYERETYDMYGIFFKDHPDLRRILTDYGFQGHPLRKDFPLSGYVEVRFDEDENRIVQEKIELAQEFRNFEFVNPWMQVNDQNPMEQSKRIQT